MMKLTLTLAVAALSLSGLAAAADDTTTTDKGVPGVEVNKAPGDNAGMPGVDVDITARMGKLDKNGDRKISKMEAAADADLTTQFSTLDGDKDGKLSMSEYASYKAKDNSTPGNEDKLGPGR
jgi:hypothetical protein